MNSRELKDLKYLAYKESKNYNLAPSVQIEAMKAYALLCIAEKLDIEKENKEVKETDY